MSENSPDAHVKLAMDRYEALSKPNATAAAKREFCLDAIEVGTPEFYIFRFIGERYDLEDLIEKHLGAFVADRDAYPNRRAIADLKLLRRLAFRRYSFALARRVNRELSKQKVSWIWLQKDYVLPRIPLALIIGYGGALSLPYSWFEVIGRSPASTTLTSLVLGIIAWFLIYANVRDRLGDVPVALRRSILVLFGGVTWSAVFVVMARWLATLDNGLNHAFNWLSAVVIAFVALLIAIVVQFFFAKAGSIADPL